MEGNYSLGGNPRTSNVYDGLLAFVFPFLLLTQLSFTCSHMQFINLLALPKAARRVIITDYMFQYVISMLKKKKKIGPIGPLFGLRWRTWIFGFAHSRPY